MNQFFRLSHHTLTLSILMVPFLLPLQVSALPGGYSAEVEPWDTVTYRNPYQWPFSKNSIWNMPIGTGARFIEAGISPQTARGTVAYHNIIVFSRSIRIVYSGQNTGSTIRILDLYGREVAAFGRSFRNDLHIPIPDLPPEIYLAVAQYHSSLFEVEKFMIPE